MERSSDLPPFVRASGGEVLLVVWLQPSAARDEVAGAQDGWLRLRVSAPPVEGRANEAARRLLAEVLGVAPSAVRLLRGETGRRKWFAVRGISPAEVPARLGPYLAPSPGREVHTDGSRRGYNGNR